GKGDSAHVVEGSSDEGYENGETLVVSSWEPEESETLDSSDSCDDGELGDFELGLVSEVLGRSCVLQGEEHGGYTLVETQFEVESSDNGT
ncbi:hypothetical protein A2U01_0081860, partial [Trifolium medium]|nr:hypothetical protein [Trifolium medium]